MFININITISMYCWKSGIPDTEQKNQENVPVVNVILNLKLEINMYL